MSFVSIIRRYWSILPSKPLRRKTSHIISHRHPLLEREICIVKNIFHEAKQWFPHPLSSPTLLDVDWGCTTLLDVDWGCTTLLDVDWGCTTSENFTFIQWFGELCCFKIPLPEWFPLNLKKLQQTIKNNNYYKYLTWLKLYSMPDACRLYVYKT